MSRRIYITIVTAAALISIPGAASAGSTNTTLQVSATVASACTVSTTPLNFGSFTAAALANNAINGTASLTVNCAMGTNWSATASVGTGVGATFALRKLTGPGGATLDYLLGTYAMTGGLPVAYPWGDGVTPNTSVYSNVGNGSDQVQTIGASIYQGQMVSATGAYSDTVTVTLTF